MSLLPLFRTTSIIKAVLLMPTSILLMLDMHEIREQFIHQLSMIMDEFKDKVVITKPHRYIAEDLFTIIVIEVIQVLNSISSDPYKQQLNFHPATMSHILYFDIHEYVFNDIEQYMWEAEYIVEETINGTSAQKCVLDIASTAVSYLSRISKGIVMNLYRSNSMQVFYRDVKHYIKEIDILNNGPSRDLSLIITLDKN